MKKILRTGCVFFMLLLLLPSCAGYNARRTAETPIVQALQTIPEDELLDVGIQVFKPGEVKAKQTEKEGTHPDTRKAESHFIPFHLKNTFQQSSHWGMVRVIPAESTTADVLVTGKIIDSNGKTLAVKITVKDATGKTRLEKKYRATIDDDSYKDIAQGRKDVFQGLYNAIANDTAAAMQKLRSADIKTIRRVAELKAAQDYAPDAFRHHLKTNRKGELVVNRLPATDDPMLARVLRVREREHLFLDTLNEYYEKYYDAMWESYNNWRTLDLTERVALAEQKRSALMRMAGGALLVAAAVLLEASDAGNSSILTGGLVVAGGQVFLSGVNVSKQSKMHSEALRELGESFGSEMKPIVVEFEGRQYELTGTAKEQYTRLRKLLRQIYYAETGYAPS
ncbi:MAG: hypothetical protein GY868_20990 [Deltaproteobacteria bacterium]|nr:hypothetical protein [Deltaproteobacteria bacterium]